MVQSFPFLRESWQTASSFITTRLLVPTLLATFHSAFYTRSAVSMTLLLAAKHYCYFHLDIGARSPSAECRGQCLEERRGEFALLSKIIEDPFSRCLENDVASFVEVFRRGWEAKRKSNFWCIIINERKSGLLNVLIYGLGSARFTRLANSSSGTPPAWKIVIRAFDVDDIEHPSTCEGSRVYT